jgi:1-deoxy-D-xylulose-5-phosphate synthase
MSISPNVGALSRYFNRIRMNPRFYHAREDFEERLTKLPLGVGRQIERLGPEIKAAIKAYWAPGLFFEELDLAYMGVIDGHDVGALASRASPRPSTRSPGRRPRPHGQGQGLRTAEEGGLASMEEWHAAKPKSIVNGLPTRSGAKPVPVTETDSPEGIERSRSRPRPARRRSTRRSSPTRWSPRQSGTSG